MGIVFIFLLDLLKTHRSIMVLLAIRQERTKGLGLLMLSEKNPLKDQGCSCNQTRTH